MPLRSRIERLAELNRLAILDTQPERAFDEITRMLAASLQAPITMVNMLDDRRDWFKSCIGLKHVESPSETSFCASFFTTTDPVIIVEDTTKDARFMAHPLVVGPPFIRFYASARLEVQGETIGTLCAYDMEPRTVDEEQLTNLQVLASAVVELLIKRAN